MKQRGWLALLLAVGPLLFGCAPAAVKAKTVKTFDVAITVPENMEVAQDDHRVTINPKNPEGQVTEDASVYLVCYNNESTLNISSEEYTALEGAVQRQQELYMTGFTEVSVLKEGVEKLKDIPVLRTRFEGKAQDGGAYVRDVTEFVYKNREYGMIVSYPKDAPEATRNALDTILTSLTFN
jgi:hypothetical protein